MCVLTPQGSRCLCNDTALLGSAARLAGLGINAVGIQIQHTGCDQIVEETLHHDLSHSFF